MYYCFRRLITPIAAMVAILAMGMATTARADTEVWGSVINNPPLSTDLLASGNPTALLASGNVGNFALTVLSASSNLGGGELFGASVVIQNTGSTISTLYLTMGANNYSAPIGNLNLLSHVGGTVAIGGPDNSLTFQQYVNQNNLQNDITGVSPGPQTPDITSVGSYNNDASIGVIGLTNPYSITERFTITLDPGSKINFSVSSTLAIPEPSTMAIAGLGALGMIGYGLRRRKALGA